MQGLRNRRKLTKRESNLQVRIGVRVVVVALWTYVLNLSCDICFKI